MKIYNLGIFFLFCVLYRKRTVWSLVVYEFVYARMSIVILFFEFCNILHYTPAYKYFISMLKHVTSFCQNKIGHRFIEMHAM